MKTFKVASFRLLNKCFLLLSILILSHASAMADTMLPPVTVDGLRVNMGVLGNGPRELPKSKIVVCSDAQFDDVSRLRKVAQKFFPHETYGIVDGSKPSERDNEYDTTFVYFGNGIAVNGDCFDRQPGMSEYLLLRAKLMKAESEALNARLRKQFKTNKDVVNLGSYCSHGGPSAEIDGQAYRWSVQLRSKMSCKEAYWSVFGISKLCITPSCSYAETERILELID